MPPVMTTRCHQQVLRARRGPRSDVQGTGGGPCTVRSNAPARPNASWAMVCSPVNRQTDMSENITFPQLRWRVLDVKSRTRINRTTYFVLIDEKVKESGSYLVNLNFRTSLEISRKGSKISGF